MPFHASYLAFMDDLFLFLNHISELYCIFFCDKLQYSFSVDGSQKHYIFEFSKGIFNHSKIYHVKSFDRSS